MGLFEIWISTRLGCNLHLHIVWYFGNDLLHFVFEKNPQQFYHNNLHLYTKMRKQHVFMHKSWMDNSQVKVKVRHNFLKHVNFPFPMKHFLIHPFISGFDNYLNWSFCTYFTSDLSHSMFDLIWNYMQLKFQMHFIFIFIQIVAHLFSIYRECG